MLLDRIARERGIAGTRADPERPAIMNTSIGGFHDHGERLQISGTKNGDNRTLKQFASQNNHCI
ncbi:hypothetical protein I7I50_01506 [Histoplasma capsulatum G186AR]|uniref:Uncharacterized protein n=1 Tax=Ajellomyces capsulatus TaxID=5037 RepID=A0A8H8CU79_AJECA|nr:hypothetical protein I7I52_12622 [Histoplasma capsulatum]QSS73369.1 hypothetical protein I7I50_01506 [Histoplasma capsulatum G186AR]